ncbi:trypsin-like peptidase domain-containing protein [Streptomyces sp. NBC_00847]|uniref:nSTAND1 domain-containing NTPase n=1 Tax=Streptomyces sp. NBC_00847 TaxID=2975850 RepID=UPI00225C2624|nr:trypsin-like peptidase domain-containing protein [Streptomyces sp. NBC_00847]MCX4884750.1 trypsin-like peptidase domain-containing protein [Streptomyces sp. NBC_00847]
MHTEHTDALTAAVAQVRDEDGAVVGTGFLIARDLLISCAHVLLDGGYGPGDLVSLAFPRVLGAPTVRGRVLHDGWRDPQDQDVALVRLDEALAGVAPLPLGSAAGCSGHRVRSLGFPRQAPPAGHFGSATAVGLLPGTDGAGELLQLTGANDLTTGFSGGPVLDEMTGLVVGMFTAITAPDGHDRGQGIAYATPTAVLREAWPALDVVDVTPYRGLEPFTIEHARWFRGRKAAVSQVVEALAGRPRVMLLLGPSGAGKSSLVQAGVLPALAAGHLPGSDRWRPIVVRPGTDLATSLEQAGLPGAATAGIGSAVTNLLAADPAHDRVVLVIDQFEELLAPATEPQSRDLVALTWITEAIRSEAALSVLLVMRDDFYPRLSAVVPGLLQAALEARGVLNVLATLTSEDLDAIVSGPAKDLEVSFEPGLAERIVSDVLDLGPRTSAGIEASVTVLPLLEVALSRLWERRLDHDGRLTHDAYSRIGAVTGALADWYRSAVSALDEPQRRIAQRALTALVRPADQALNIPAARQQLPLDELRDLAADDGTPEALHAVDEVLTVLFRHRIITGDRAVGPRPDDAEGTSTVELIHDTLIRDWSGLRRWVEQDTLFQGWLQRARAQQARWQEHREPRDLPAGTLLAEGMDWSNRRRLPADLVAFLNAGRRRQQAAVRRSRLLNAVLATFLVLSLAALGTAWWQRQIALAAQHAAQSRQLAAQSSALLTTDPDLASLLAITAYRTSPTPEAASALSAAASLPLRRRLTGLTQAVNSMAFSPDGKTLATAGYDGKVQLWDVPTGKTTAKLTGHDKFLAFSPDGKTLATAGEGDNVRLWDVATRKTTAILDSHNNEVETVAFSPDGRTLAAAAGAAVRLWDVATHKTTSVLDTPHDEVFTVAFSPDGKTLAAAGYTVRMLDVATGKTSAALTTSHNGLPDRVDSVAFSPDGKTLASSGEGESVRLQDVATGKTAAVLQGHTDEVWSVAFSPDGKTLATGSYDRSVRLWDVATRKTTAVLTGHTDGLRSVAFSPDGKTLATADFDRGLRLWDVTRSEITTVLTGHTGPVNTVAFSPDGHTLATGSQDQDARLWNVATGRTIATITGHTGSLNTVAFSPDGRTLATGGDDGLRLWDVTTGKTTAVVVDNASVFSVAFSPDGKTLAFSLYRNVGLWDVTSRKWTATLDSHSDYNEYVYSVKFSPDGKTLATAGEGGSAHLWDVASRKTTTILNSHTPAVASVVFSPDGKTLATAGVGASVRLWDLTTGRTTGVLTGHTQAVVSAAFSPDGKTLAIADTSASVQLWDVNDGKITAVLTGHAKGVRSVAFSPDGKTIATGSKDFAARLWTYTAPDAAMRVLCKAVARDLTKAEKVAYLPSASTRLRICQSNTGN